MSFGLVFLLLFLAVCLVGLCIQASKLWHGDEKAVRTLQLGFATFPASAETKRGIIRGIVPLTAQMFFLTVTVVAGVQGMSSGQHGQLTPGLAVALVALAAMVLCFALHLAVIWFNRPLFLVPPSMRDELGVFRRPRLDKPA